MSEWIEKKEAMRAVGHCDMVSPSLSDEFFQSLKIRNAAITAINDIPAAGVAPVVHGKWIENGIEGSVLSGCSVCGFGCGAYSFNYCPNCGAKMDGEE